MPHTCRGNEGWIQHPPTTDTPSSYASFTFPAAEPPPTPVFQNTLSWVSLLAVSWLQHGSSVISSDSRMRKGTSQCLCPPRRCLDSLLKSSLFKTPLSIQTSPREWNRPLTRLAHSFCCRQRLGNRLLIIRLAAGTMLIYNLAPCSDWTIVAYLLFSEGDDIMVALSLCPRELQHTKGDWRWREEERASKGGRSLNPLIPSHFQSD